MKKVVGLLVVTGFFANSLAVNADYIEIGSEVEKYNSRYSSNDLYLPYVEYKLGLSEHSPWYISGAFSYSYRDESDQRDNNNFGRYEFFTGYEKTYGNLKIKPKIGVRHEVYNNQTALSEIRIFPNFDYTVSDQTTIFLDGFLAPVPKKDFDRSSASTETLKSYNDYKHELKFGVSYKIATDQKLNVSFYNEFNKTNDLVDAIDPLDGSEEIKNEWQLRLEYQKFYDKYSIMPWTRIGLHRQKENINGLKKDELRHRIGFDTSYHLNKDYTIRARLYIQKENKENWGGEGEDAKYRHYLKLALRRHF